jgi:glycosyltransferase involved in cell wall biosynthesis
MLSIIITTHQEAQWLPYALERITSVLPSCDYEFIIVDDQSDDTTQDVLTHFANRFKSVSIVMPEKRGGVSASRRFGVTHASGDVLCFLDAHVFPSQGFFDLLHSTALEHPDSIVAPALTEHRLTDPFTPVPDKPRGTNYGGSFTFACKRWWFYMSVTKHPKRWERRNGTYACGMTMTRQAYNRVGGWMALPGFWSSSDVAMCIKAWMLGVPIIIETKAHHYHGVKGFSQHYTPKWHEVINRFYASKVIFDSTTYENIWKPAFMKRFGRHWSDAVFLPHLESDQIAAEHEHVRSNVVRTDQEFIESFVYPRLDKYGLPHDPSADSPATS